MNRKPYKNRKANMFSNQLNNLIFIFDIFLASSRSKREDKRQRPTWAFSSAWINFQFFWPFCIKLKGWKLARGFSKYQLYWQIFTSACQKHCILAVVPSVAWDFLFDKHINLTNLTYLTYFSLKLNLKTKLI